MGGIDYTKIPTNDLEALSKGDYASVSTTTLEMLSGSAGATEAQPTKAEIPVAPFMIGPMPINQTIVNAVQNVPSSAAETFRTIFDAVMSPKKTIEGVAKVAAGGLEKLTGKGTGENIPIFDAFIKNYTDRYGSLDKIRETFERDPVGTMMDASGLLGGMGNAFKLAARVGGNSLVARVGQALSDAGRASHPVSVAKEVVSPVVKVGAKVAEEGIGMITGAGPESIRQSVINPVERIKAAWGKITADDLLKEAEGALQTMKNNAASDYAQRMEQIGKNTQQLDVSPLAKLRKKWMDELKITRERNFDTGGYDYNVGYQSKLTDNKSIEAAKKVMSILDDWGNNPSDFTAAGLDALKQKLDNFYVPDKVIGAMVDTLKKQTKDIIVKSVPEYAEMTKNYSTYKELYDDVSTALSITDKAMKDTTLRKLSSTMRSNFQFRNELLQHLADQGRKPNLPAHIAGYETKNLFPKGLIGPGFDIHTMFAAGWLHNPAIAGLAVLSSPRVVGDFLSAASAGYQAMQQAKQAFPLTSTVLGTVTDPRTLYQVGRIPQGSQK